MGLEGAVRLALRKELEAIEDPDERERTVRETTAVYQRTGKRIRRRPVGRK
jgi:acetyl-CoA carboxylase carboxyltransferase component